MVFRSRASPSNRRPPNVAPSQPDTFHVTYALASRTACRRSSGPVASREYRHRLVPRVGHVVQHRRRVQRSAEIDGALRFELQGLGGRGKPDARFSRPLGSAFATAFEPAKVGAGQLERGTTLPKRGESVVVEVRERLGNEPFKVAAKTLGVAAKRIPERAPRKMRPEKGDRGLMECATGQLRSIAQFCDFHVGW